MIDEIFDRSYRSGHAELNASITSGLRTLGRAVRNTFEVLNRIEYQSPWTDRKGKVRVH